MQEAEARVSYCFTLINLSRAGPTTRLRTRPGTSLCDVEHKSSAICPIRSPPPQPFDTLLSNLPCPACSVQREWHNEIEGSNQHGDRQGFLPRAFKERSSERIRR